MGKVISLKLALEFLMHMYLFVMEIIYCIVNDFIFSLQNYEIFLIKKST